MLLRNFVAINRKICLLLENKFPKFFAYPRNYHVDQLNLISKILNLCNHAKVLEVGGVDRPMLTKSKSYTYYGMDIDDRPSCYNCYDKFLVQSIEDNISDKFDLIVSTTLLEHVPNNKKSVQSMFNSLNEGGQMVHYIPSKNHFYSICLRLVGPKIQKILIKHLRPEAISVTGYPAFFDKCSPYQMKKLFKKQGFIDVEIVPYYRATDYFRFFIPAYLFVAVFENCFEYLGLSQFASGFINKEKK